MLILPIEEAEPGMKLAAPVLHPANADQELLHRGYILEQAVIARLRELEVAAICVDYPALDHLDRHLAVLLSPARQIMYGQIKNAIINAQGRSTPRINYHEYVGSVRELITTLLSQGSHPIYMDQMARLGSDAISHATSVAHLALLLGMKLENYLIQQRRRLPPLRARDTTSLGVAAMLHDLGLTKLPEEFRQYSDPDPPADPTIRREWETHSQVGYDMIRNATEPAAAATVLHHHEHFDGSGFPCMAVKNEEDDGHLDGQRIHVFARILMAANLFDRLASPAKTNKRRSNLEVLFLLRTRFASWIDPEVMTALQQVVPAFPPGCRLHLSDGSLAIVTDFNPRNPFRPIVRRVIDGKWAVGGEDIDLSNDFSLRIKSFDNLEVDHLIAA